MGTLRLVAALVAASMMLVTGCGGGSDGTDDLQRLADGLRSGGQVILLRHAATDNAVDMTGDLSDCSRQRNLSLEGRREAGAIGPAIRRLDIRVGRVLASPFCRTRDTARLAVGRVTPTRALLSTDQLSGPAAKRQRRAVRRLLTTEPRRGTNTLLVSHESVIDAATGVNVEEGEALIVRPRAGGSGFRVTGRLQAADWRDLR